MGQNNTWLQDALKKIKEDESSHNKRKKIQLIIAGLVFMALSVIFISLSMYYTSYTMIFFFMGCVSIGCINGILGVWNLYKVRLLRFGPKYQQRLEAVKSSIVLGLYNGGSVMFLASLILILLAFYWALSLGIVLLVISIPILIYSACSKHHSFSLRPPPPQPKRVVVREISPFFLKREGAFNILKIILLMAPFGTESFTLLPMAKYWVPYSPFEFLSNLEWWMLTLFIICSIVFVILVIKTETETGQIWTWIGVYILIVASGLLIHLSTIFRCGFSNAPCSLPEV